MIWDTFGWPGTLRNVRRLSGEPGEPERWVCKDEERPGTAATSPCSAPTECGEEFKYCDCN